MHKDNLSHTLPIGYLLKDTYEIESVIGEGGFGITYKAIVKSNSVSPKASAARSSHENTGISTDNSHQEASTQSAYSSHAAITVNEHDKPSLIHVAIKEYYPSGIATRNTQHDNPYTVTHFNGRLELAFNKGLERFRQEACLLREFEGLESIVTVLDIFDENDTTYIVMEYIEGLTIQKLIEREGVLPYTELMELMTPLLMDLNVIHGKGLIHRDISPDNLLIGTDNRLHLIDFGSANHSNIHASKTFTVILKAGYAPPEQYSPKGKIGPWTDVYGCSAVMYYALTGHPPMDSLQRIQKNSADYGAQKGSADHDLEEHLLGIAGLPLHAKNVIITGLSLSYKERYPSTRMFNNALTTSPANDDTQTRMVLADSQSNVTTHYSDNENSKSRSGMDITIRRRRYVYAALLLIILVIGSAYAVPFIINSINNTNPDNTITAESKVLVEASTDSSSDNVSDNTTDSNGYSNPGYNYASGYNSEILTMVNLIGKDLEQARTALKELDSDIEIQTIDEYSKTYSEGTIIAQSIQSNTQFTKGNISTITLTISLGDKPTSATDAAKSTSTGTSSGSNKSAETYKVTGSGKDDGYTTIHIGE